MSLLNALLLDSYRTNLWVAYRTDGVGGSGTQSDPFDGSTQAKFDALMNAMPMLVSSLTYLGTTATVTAISHGYVTMSSPHAVVVIAGVTGASANLFNGSFTITYVDANTFTYTMSGTPSASPSGSITCRLSTANGPAVGLDVNPPLAIRLGPGTFQTNGYADLIATAGWQPRPGMKIVGSGIDVTILQVAGSSSGTSGHLYAVGHAVTSNSQPNLLDYFEVCDLTIDCNLSGSTGASIASGAVRVMGNHAKIRRIKVTNWGTKATSNPCFVVSVITASDTGSVEDCGIEECIAISPQGTGNSGPMTVFHAGGTEGPPAVPLSYGVAPYIRNCFVDAGEASPFSPEVRGLSMAWCKAGTLEGNQVHNLTYGTFQQATAAQDLVVRNNWFKNVNRGVLLGGTGAASGSGSLTMASSVATVTIASGHNVHVGDSVLLNTTGAYNGLVVQVLASGFSSTAFQFNTSSTTTSDTVNSVQRAFGVSNVVIECNVVELATATSGTLIGIHLQDGSLGTTPQDAIYPLYLFNKVLLRDNKLRYLDGAINGGFAGYPIQANSAVNLLVRNNVVESDPSHPLRNDRCQSVVYFNNLTPAGVLEQGWNGDSSAQYEELATLTDFALIMGLFNKKA